MPRRTFQQVIARDPAYSGSFGTDQVSKVEPLTPKELPPPVGEPSQAPEVVQPAQEKPSPPMPSLVPGSGLAPSRPQLQPGGLADVAERPSHPIRRKVHVPVRLRPLAEQVDHIAATGLRPRDVLKAAWRKATSGYVLGPDYIAPASVSRAGGAASFFNTTLTVDAEALAALARVHDPLGVQGGWWLLRGQVEPRFWGAIEDVLAQVAADKAPDGTTS